MSGLAFRRSSAEDACAISSLVTAAFGGPGEAALIETLRRDGDMLHEFVATARDEVVAHIAFSRLDMRHGDATLRAAALAPLAVAPAHQRAGAGTALTHHALKELRCLEQQVVVVLGHPAYYPRFGFSALLAKSLDAPYSGDSFMVLELSPGALAKKRWKVAYPPAFAPKSNDDSAPRNR
jgi:putative acetyltransferase